MEIIARVAGIEGHFTDVTASGVQLDRIPAGFDFDLIVTHFDGSWDELLDAAKSNKEYRLVEVDRG